MRIVTTVAATTASTSPVDIAAIVAIVTLLSPFAQGFAQRGFGTVAARLVKACPRDLGGKVLLRHPSLWFIVGIDVSLAVAEYLGAAIVRVPQVHRDRPRGAGPHGGGRSGGRPGGAGSLSG